MRTSILVLLIIALMAVSDGKGSKKSSPVKDRSKEKESTKGLKLLTKEETTREKEGSKKERKSKEETRSRSDESNDNNSNVDKSKTRSKEDGIELRSLLSSSRRTSSEPAIVSESPIIKRSLSLAGSLLNPANLVKTVVDAAVNLYCSLDGRLIPCKDAQGGKYLAPLNFRCRALADVIFVVDSSGSIGSINFKKQLSFIANLAASFFVGANDVRVGLVVFSTNSQIWFDLKEYTDLFSIQKAILETPYEGEVTYTDKALKLISSSYLFESFSGGRDNAPDIVVILTDGQSTNPFATLSEANKLKSRGVTMLSIGITSGIKETELLSLASRPEFFFKVEDFDVLNNFLGQIVEQTCQVSEGVKVKVQTKSSVTEQEPQYYEQEPAQYNEQEPAQYNEQEPAQYNEQDPFYYQGNTTFYCSSYSVEYGTISSVIVNEVFVLPLGAFRLDGQAFSK
uniref:VWFA domain-containing protein n=1 Tax=Biomphalaria glabrata TaxID=6526 RepID=A0A2C9JUC6_BIOGL